MHPNPILKTKFFIPPLRDGIVIRSRLIEVINENVKKKLLFVSAPAGFGKSTLLSEWVNQSKLPVAWVSLDKTENDPVDFLSYLISGVQSIYRNLGEAILSDLKAPGSPPINNLFNAWINEIAEHTEEFVLILDDFHHIQDKSVVELFCNLIDHQPPQLHLLLASRADLPISCSRIRVRGELIELAISDLRFTVEETSEFLKGQLGSKISDTDAKKLGERTEGWIAGLQMAVLSLRSSNDISQFVAQFSAQNRYITDYLLDEVLLRQPEEINQFLLATSILERFSAPLCNQVVGIQNSQDIIALIERSGLFIISLDSSRTWYRYHHLFAELLKKRLMDANSLQREILHRRAFEWFASRDMLEECINHAFAVNDYDLVIRTIERSLNIIMAEGKFRNYLAWTEAIPKEDLEKKPRLEIVKVFMLHEMGRFAERDKQLQFVENLLGPPPVNLNACTSGEIINHGILASIQSIIYASGIFLVDDTIRSSELAKQLLPEDQILWQALSMGAIPFLDRALGNYEKAIAGYTEVLKLIMKANFTFQAFIIYSALAKTYLEIGKLKLAIITCQKAIDLDIKNGGNLPFAKLSYLIMGELMYKAGQLVSAEEYIDLGLEHVVRHGEIFSIIDGYFTLARIQIAGEDTDQALALIREMKLVISELSPSKNALKIANACEAYVMIFAGQLGQAEKRIKGSGFDQLEGKYLFDLESHSYVGIYRVSQNPISIYSDFIRMTSARLYLAMDRLEDGLTIINEVLHNRTRAKHNKYQIESMLIKAILLQKLGQPIEAEKIFHEAIHLASREGFIQAFLNEGLTIKGLLESVKEIEIGDIEEQVFIIRLLEEIQMGVRYKSDQTSQDTEQLTPREIEVLDCLSTDPSYSRAAELLSISRNTLKTHTRHIYQKLGVSGLLQALNKAKELKILD